MKDRNDFSLPDDLGWDCNDELSELIIGWLAEFLPKLPPLQDHNAFTAMTKVGVAQLMDDVYTVIKKYQEAQND